ncbi:MAG: hypothetical protein WBQ73_02210 [Candidatus Babeliales bacterium]
MDIKINHIAYASSFILSLIFHLLFIINYGPQLWIQQQCISHTTTTSINLKQSTTLPHKTFFVQNVPPLIPLPSKVTIANTPPVLTTQSRTLPTLSSIVQSFLQQQSYKPYKTLESPSDESAALVLTFYQNKVWSLLCQSCQTYRIEHHKTGTSQFLCIVSLTINQEGTLETVKVSHITPQNQPHLLTTTYKTIQTIAHQVGLYPPIPSSLAQDRITVTFPCVFISKKNSPFYQLFLAHF